MPEYPQLLLVVGISLVVDGQVFLLRIVPVEQIVHVVLVLKLNEICAAGFVEGAVANGFVIIAEASLFPVPAE